MPEQRIADGPPHAPRLVARRLQPRRDVPHCVRWPDLDGTHVRAALGRGRSARAGAKNGPLVLAVAGMALLMTES